MAVTFLQGFPICHFPLESATHVPVKLLKFHQLLPFKVLLSVNQPLQVGGKAALQQKVNQSLQVGIQQKVKQPLQQKVMNILLNEFLEPARSFWGPKLLVYKRNN